MLKKLEKLNFAYSQQNLESLHTVNTVRKKCVSCDLNKQKPKLAEKAAFSTDTVCVDRALTLIPPFFYITLHEISSVQFCPCCSYCSMFFWQYFVKFHKYFCVFMVYLLIGEF